MNLVRLLAHLFHFLISTNEPVVGPHEHRPLSLSSFIRSPGVKLFDVKITSLPLLLCLFVISDHVNITKLSTHDR